MIFKDLFKSHIVRDVGYIKTMQEMHGDFFDVLKAYLRALAAVDGHKQDRKTACSMIADGLVVNYLDLAVLLSSLAIKKYENTLDEYCRVVNRCSKLYKEKFKTELLKCGFGIHEVTGDNLTELQIAELKRIHELPELDMFSE